MQRLILTCDDGGLTEAANHAALALHERGMVTALSVLANAPATPHALELCARTPTLECGVHLTLSSGLPLTDIRSPSALTRPDGAFRSWRSLFRRALLPGAAFRALVEAELVAQVAVFARAGIQPGHLTTHMHFHLFPALRGIVFDLARRSGVGWVRAYRLRARVTPGNALLRRGVAAAPASAAQVAVPDYLVPLRRWLEHDPVTLGETMLALPGTVELVFHPPEASDWTAEVRYLERLYPLLVEAGVAFGL